MEAITPALLTTQLMDILLLLRVVWSKLFLSVSQDILVNIPQISLMLAVPSPSLLLRSDSIILVGEETVVYCDIDLIGVVRGSDVAVDVIWLKEGVPVSTDSRVTISGVTVDEDGVSSSLTFSPVHFSDMTTYECHVTLTPLLGPASPVSSSQSLHLDIGVCVCVCVCVCVGVREREREIQKMILWPFIQTQWTQ